MRELSRPRSPWALQAGRALCAVVGLGVVVGLHGCGVPVQEEPALLAVTPPPRPAEAPPEGGVSVTVYLVRGARLYEVQRAAPERSAAAALERLSAGPTTHEVMWGARTALVPQPFAVAPDPDAPTGTVVLSAGRDLSGVSGGAQLLAVAQLVWTVTAVPGVQQVRFVVEGSPAEVPTEDGLRAGPVDRSDYDAVAPAPPRPAPPASSAPAP